MSVLKTIEKLKKNKKADTGTATEYSYALPDLLGIMTYLFRIAHRYKDNKYAQEKLITIMVFLINQGKVFNAEHTAYKELFSLSEKELTHHIGALSHATKLAYKYIVESQGDVAAPPMIEIILKNLENTNKDSTND